MSEPLVRPTRRAAIRGSLALAAYPILPRQLSAATMTDLSLVASSASVPLVGAPYPDTEVWAYSGAVPGPEIRARQGDRLRVRFENRLPHASTVHWHGVRVPNAMDGVPYLTQMPVDPGGTFVYEFDLKDAGTFWYHPHVESAEQVERGLAGALVVAERDPPRVDRDMVWLLDDWRLKRSAAISDDFGNLHDISHAGRIGNTVTVNGRVRDAFWVRAGERIRLRLINAANARIFALRFNGHDPQVIALDGQPVEPHAPDDGRIIIAPAQRVDVILDLTGAPGARFTVQDTFYRGQGYRLLDLAYTDEVPLRPEPPGTPVRLQPNPMPSPRLAQASRHEIVFGGGMMGGMAGGMVDGRRLDMRGMMMRGLAWTINGVAASGHAHEPLLMLQRDETCILSMRNETAWHHPMHLHGHSFQVLSRNGEPARREWLDTVLMAPREQVEIAFVADNPGDWMFHCHILEHQAGGMMGTIRVS